MIISFGNTDTELIWAGKYSKKYPNEIQNTARRKLRMIHNSVDIKDLLIPPSNKLEKLKGKLKDYYTIRINIRWRIIFKWDGNNAIEVEIKDYH